MNRLVLIFLFLFASTATAAISDIQISSFSRVGANTISSPMLAEICGFVVGDLPAMVTVTSDPTGNKANYVTLTDDKGNYCQTISTYTGRAAATAVSLYQNGESKSAKAELK